VKRTQKSNLANRQGLETLSTTERRVLRLLADYKTSKQIAEELFISHRTVENHRSNICQKLDIHGSHALMKFALEHKDSLFK
jgi:DNA-binding CsgD family transcriptional regulator